MQINHSFTLCFYSLSDLQKIESLWNCFIKCHSKYKKKSFIGQKTLCGKGRKCWLAAFSPLTTMFSKTFFLWSGLYVDLVNNPELKSFASRLLLTVKKKALQNIVGKEENAGHQHFLLFQLCFLASQREIVILAMFNTCMLSAISFFHPLENFNKEFNKLWKKRKMLMTKTFSLFSTLFAILWFDFHYMSHNLTFDVWKCLKFSLT